MSHLKGRRAVDNNHNLTDLSPNKELSESSGFSYKTKKKKGEERGASLSKEGRIYVVPLNVRPFRIDTLQNIGQT